MTIGEFGTRFRLSPEELDLMLDRNEIRAIKLGPERYIALSAVRRFIAERAAEKRPARRKKSPRNLTSQGR